MTSMKEQAIAHWEDNLKRVEAMDWGEWIRARGTTRRTVVFSRVGDKYPHIGGEVCPYCTRYSWSCSTPGKKRKRCPLKQEYVSGGCCIA